MVIDTYQFAAIYHCFYHLSFFFTHLLSVFIHSLSIILFYHLSPSPPIFYLPSFSHTIHLALSRTTTDPAPHHRTQPIQSRQFHVHTGGAPVRGIRVGV